MGESLREFLDRRERELQAELIPAEAQVGAIRAELSEVHRARTALGEPRNENQGDSLHSDGLVAGLGAAVAHAAGASSAVGLGAAQVLPPMLNGVPLSEAFEHAVTGATTIKGMILRALREDVNFLRNGALTAELREFIKSEYGRDIETTSLSPQLSRLREDGLITAENNRWRRVPRKIGDLYKPRGLT